MKGYFQFFAILFLLQIILSCNVDNQEKQKKTTLPIQTSSWHPNDLIIDKISGSISLEKYIDLQADYLQFLQSNNENGFYKKNGLTKQYWSEMVQFVNSDFSKNPDSKKKYDDLYAKRMIELNSAKAN